MVEVRDLGVVFLRRRGCAYPQARREITQTDNPAKQCTYPLIALSIHRPGRGKFPTGEKATGERDQPDVLPEGHKRPTAPPGA